MKNVLFLCSQNRLRSPTAEKVFSGIKGFDVRSAGLHHDATQPVTPELIQWAHYIFVMERAHRNKLYKKYKTYIDNQVIICLNIADEYEYMDKELIHLLKSKLDVFFQTHSCDPLTGQ
jgi:predicted protein tyrosine phosphatase